ncbi:MAG: hypothetical protein HEQ39_10700 [Rhizobacter sp.]
MKTITPFKSLLLASLLILTACSKEEASKPAAAQAADAAVFKVLATSDLRDAQPLEAMVEKAIGVKLRFTYGGTMESTEAVLTGKTDAQAAWFANAKYLLSDPQGQARVKLQEKIMLSPITLGVSQSVAKQLGWDDPKVAEQVTWRTITQAAASGKITYALSNPATSNQGFMALMGVVAAASNKGRGPDGARCRPQRHCEFLEGLQTAGR